jgi:hypothetical protein
MILRNEYRFGHAKPLIGNMRRNILLNEAQEKEGMRMAEKEMEIAVSKMLAQKGMVVGHQVALGNFRFDIVAYDKTNRVFKVIECKLGSHQTGLGKTFGQLSVYSGRISSLADEFVDSASKKMEKMRFGRWMEATDCGRRIRVEFYVAVSNKACKDVDCLQRLKQQNQSVGIIRCKEDGTCRNYVRVNGQPNYDLAKAACQVFLLSEHWLANGTQKTN